MLKIKKSNLPGKKIKIKMYRFDEDEDGVVSCKEVGKILRNLGYNPSDAELQVALKGL